MRKSYRSSLGIARICDRRERLILLLSFVVSREKGLDRMVRKEQERKEGKEKKGK